MSGLCAPLLTDKCKKEGRGCKVHSFSAAHLSRLDGPSCQHRLSSHAHRLTHVWFGCVRTPPPPLYQSVQHTVHTHTPPFTRPGPQPTPPGTPSGRGTEGWCLHSHPAQGQGQEGRTGEDEEEQDWGGEEREERRGRGREGRREEQGRGKRRAGKEMGVYQKMMRVNKFSPSSLDTDLILPDPLRSN